MSVDVEKLRVGDTVRVNNIPGPRMIVTGFAQAERGKPEPVANVHCKWFDKRGIFDGNWFPARMLHKVAPFTERPGYRAALEAIRDNAFIANTVLGTPSIKVNMNTIADGVVGVGLAPSLVDYINDVLNHRFPMRQEAPTESEHEETSDAAE